MYYLLFLSFLFNQPAEKVLTEETIHFSLVYKEKVVGELNATKTKNNEATVFSSSTKTTISFGWDFLILFNTSASIENGKLRVANSDISVNGKSHANSETQKSGNEYKFLKEGKEKGLIKEPIQYCSAMLLFVEPQNVSLTYSEKEGEFHKLAHIGNHVYQKTDPKGRTNLYHYKNGQLEKAEIDAGLINFKVIRKD